MDSDAKLDSGKEQQPEALDTSFLSEQFLVLGIFLQAIPQKIFLPVSFSLSSSRDHRSSTNQPNNKMRIHFLSSLLVAFLPCSAYAFSAPAIAVDARTAQQNPLKDFDFESNNKLPWLQEGYNTWKWKDHDINYIELGDPSKPAIVLIHGFGASSYHWRYNIPELAKDYHVFAYCKLGFGLSSKPVQEYAPEVWRDQAVDFLKEVVQKPATLAGNSLGGFTALYAAATDEAKPMVNGVALLNGAGRFRDSAPVETKEPNQIIEVIQKAIQRLVIGASFIVTKQPARIKQVLKQVYPVNPDLVDDELVESIRFPSLDPNAAEVFYRVISKNGNGPGVYIDDLLENLECPLLLCWGEKDPWIRSEAADKVQALFPKAQRVSIDAGHCPHDEAPEAVNSAIRNFAASIQSA
jgi:pimeloyl-ACP methyl ester carboxylesterase